MQLAISRLEMCLFFLSTSFVYVNRVNHPTRPHDTLCLSSNPSLSLSSLITALVSLRQARMLIAKYIINKPCRLRWAKNHETQAPAGAAQHTDMTHVAKCTLSVRYTLTSQGTIPLGRLLSLFPLATAFLFPEALPSHNICCSWLIQRLHAWWYDS